MACAPKMAHGKISLACSIHCCSKFFISFAQPASLYCEEYVYIHIPYFIETVYKLPLLPNNTVHETFYRNQEWCLSVDWIFIIVVPAWG